MHNPTENFGFKVTLKLEHKKVQLLYKDNLVFNKKKTPLFFFLGLTGTTKMFKANQTRSFAMQMLTQQCLFVPRFSGFAKSASFSQQLQAAIKTIRTTVECKTQELKM